MPSEDATSYLSDVCAVRVHEDGDTLRSSSVALAAQENDMSLRLLALLASPLLSAQTLPAPASHGSEVYGIERSRFEEEEPSQDQDDLGRALRSDPDGGSGQPRSSSDRTTMLWKPRTCSSVSRIGERGQRTCLMDRMREVQIEAVIHPSVWSHWNPPSSWSVARGHQEGGGEAWSGCALQQGAQGSGDRLGGCRTELAVPLGGDPSSKEGSRILDDLDGNPSGSERKHDTISGQSDRSRSRASTRSRQPEDQKSRRQCRAAGRPLASDLTGITGVAELGGPAISSLPVKKKGSDDPVWEVIPARKIMVRPMVRKGQLSRHQIRKTLNLALKKKNGSTSCRSSWTKRRRSSRRTPRTSMKR